MPSIPKTIALILSLTLLICLYGNPFWAVSLPIYLVMTLTKLGTWVIIVCLIISCWLVKYIYEMKMIELGSLKPLIISSSFILSSYLFFWGTSSIFIQGHVLRIKPDETIKTSHYSYLHRRPTLEYVYDRPSRVIIR